MSRLVPWAPPPRPAQKGQSCASRDGSQTGNFAPVRFGRRAALALMAGALALAACSDPVADQGLLPLPDGGTSKYADTLISVRQGGQLRRCFGSNPDPACASVPVLGPPDGNRYTLGVGDVLEVALLGGFIIEHPTANPFELTPDVRLWVTVPPPLQSNVTGGLCGSAVVEVSSDGTTYHTLDCIRKNDQEIDLGRSGLTAARFVRIVDLGVGGIAVDSVEAL